MTDDPAVAALSKYRGSELRKRRRRFDLLASWYGAERAEREMAAHTIQPRSIGPLVESVLAGVRRPENGLLIRIRSRWPEIMGDQFARFTEPVALRNGVMTLKVRHSALLQELRESPDLIRARVNARMGADICSSIRFTVG